MWTDRQHATLTAGPAAGRLGYLACFTHAGCDQAERPQVKRNSLAALLAHSINLGLTRMAESSGISYDILAWTGERYVREQTLWAGTWRSATTTSVCVSCLIAFPFHRGFGRPARADR